MKLAEQIAKFSAILQEIGSDLYVRAFHNQGIAALTLGQFRYLEIINKNPGITPGELSEIFDVKKPTVTQIIKVLLKRKLIEKYTDETDKRISKLYATDATKAIVRYRYKMFEIFAGKIEKILSPEELDTYRKLTANIIETINGEK